LSQNTVNETIVNIEAKCSQWNNSILLQCWLVSLTVFWFNVDYCFIDCILAQWWLFFHWLYFGSMLTIASLTVFCFNVDNIEPKYSQWNNSQHWTKIQSMKQLSTLNQNTVNETIVNIQPKYYCFIDCMLVQCWLLFHWLYFGSMLTIFSLTVFWFDVDVNIESKYSQWNISQHWSKIQSVKQ
jgi:hypothetical protein